MLAEIERDDALVFERFGHVAARDALRHALDDGRLAHAGLADEHRVVLGAAREHLHHAANLFVAPDDRVELAAARRVGEIAGVLFERLEFPFGVLIGDALRATHLGERAEKLVVAETVAIEDRLHVAVLLGRAEEEVLDRHEVVFEGLGFVFGALDHLEATRGKRGLGAAGYLGKALDARFETLDAALRPTRPLSARAARRCRRLG